MHKQQVKKRSDTIQQHSNKQKKKGQILGAGHPVKPPTLYSPEREINATREDAAAPPSPCPKYKLTYVNNKVIKYREI